jgi:hypothetical protein
MLKGDNLNTLIRYMQSGINLFAGSGFSILAKDCDGTPLPLGKQLLAELLEKFPSVNGKNLSLSQVCTVLERTRRDEYTAFIVDRFKVGDYDKRYRNLERVTIKAIFTTNVDDLLIRIYENSIISYLSDLNTRGPAEFNKSAINTVWLHGCINDLSKRLVFSTTDIASTFHADPDRWHFLTGQLQRHPTVLVGYSAEDSSTLQALSPSVVSGRPHADKWILLHNADTDGSADYFRALGFQILMGDTESFLDFIGEIDVSDINNNDIQRSETKDLFPEYAIPKAGTVPDRALLKFYEGAPPIWSDIFSARLHKTEHASRIRDVLAGGKNTIVIGVPASGKSTLLMQTACDLDTSDHKLVVDSLTLEQAHYIVNRLAGQRATIFIDQCCDDAQALHYLCSSSNLLVAGFDREYNFEIVSHLFESTDLTVIPVTDLSERDSQSILDRVPTELVSVRNGFPELVGEQRPSMFELLDMAIRGRRLHDRFLSAIQQLRNRDQSALDLLLINCYVHSCRTSVSLDMLLAYFGKDLDYREIYDTRDRLGSLLADVNEPLAGDNQDYYLPRSSAVAEAVMTQVPSSDLKRVLSRFHDQVSPTRIFRYDVFKKQAYDHKTIARAFDKADEGNLFYEAAYERTGNPYLLQHQALYLSGKKRYSDAFRVIDEALTKTTGRNFTIRNSHAHILFKANENRNPCDPVVEQTLRESMEILAQCYMSDRRKAFHALTFAEQAIKFSQIYGLQSAGDYLKQAKKWLREEQIRSPWHRKVTYMLRDIERTNNN